jgi:predicted esterase YcpF (UPF0227 family)
MTKNIFYFHGFKSSSDSNKAKIFKRFLKDNSKTTKIFVPDLKNKFEEAIKQIQTLVDGADGEIMFAGSSLGGYYATIFAEKYNSKAILINPAVYPLKDFEEHLGENINYSTKISSPDNFLVLLESDDEILNYLETVSFYEGSYIDISFGGDHSYSSLEKKLSLIQSFLDL